MSHSHDHQVCLDAFLSTLMQAIGHPGEFAERLEEGLECEFSGTHNLFNVYFVDKFKDIFYTQCDYQIFAHAVFFLDSQWRYFSDEAKHEMISTMENLVSSINDLQRLFVLLDFLRQNLPQSDFIKLLAALLEKNNEKIGEIVLDFTASIVKEKKYFNHLHLIKVEILNKVKACEFKNLISIAEEIDRM